uniref:SPIN-DOC-like zinc-finger domain-containing protein n=1 Tax=Rhinolophus ferrumequinum TaxID=59479 RepID=A0A671DNN0_RHIFE
MTTPKKRKTASDCRKFQTWWENEYFFMEVKGKCVCLIYNESVSVMKEYNVRRHHETKHQTYMSYTGVEREQKVKQMTTILLAQQQYFSCAKKTEENAIIASYEVAQLIAQHGKAFSDGEFIKQCLTKVAGIMCPEKSQEFDSVSLSRNTVVQRIEDLSANIKHQLSDKTCAFDFCSVVCDESTDATDTAQLLIFLRGVDNNFCVTEELLDLSSLNTTTTGKDICEAVSNAVDKTGLKWDKLCGVTTMERAEVGQVACAVSITHQEALCATTVQLSDMVNTVVKTVNRIRVRALYHREFQTFLPGVDAEYGDLLYHSEAPWLSRGSVLRRFYSLRSEIDQFFKEKDRPLHELSDPRWLADLAFSVDLTEHLNTLNKNLQGKDQLVPQLPAHMKAFCVKPRLFEAQLCTFNVAPFPTLSEIRSAFPKADLSDRKGKYVSNDIKLFATPFMINAEEVQESLQLELIEMQCDDSLRNQHQLLSLPDFYRSLEGAKFLPRRRAKRMISLFGASYICEQTVSLMRLNKSRLRTKMTNDHLCDVHRISTTKLTPDLRAIPQVCQGPLSRSNQRQLF